MLAISKAIEGLGTVCEMLAGIANTKMPTSERARSAVSAWSQFSVAYSTCDEKATQALDPKTLAYYELYRNKIMGSSNQAIIALLIKKLEEDSPEQAELARQKFEQAYRELPTKEEIIKSKSGPT